MLCANIFLQVRRPTPLILLLLLLFGQKKRRPTKRRKSEITISSSSRCTSACTKFKRSMKSSLAKKHSCGRKKKKKKSCLYKRSVLFVTKDIETEIATGHNQANQSAERVSHPKNDIAVKMYHQKKRSKFSYYLWYI